jgi:hypothetical protein
VQQPFLRCAVVATDYRSNALVVPELHVPLSRGPPPLS